MNERYSIDAVLQRGPLSSTYRGRDLETDTEVVLKEVALDSLPTRADGGGFKTVELLEREGRVLRHLDHPGIPKLLDTYETNVDGRVSFWLVQELRAGRNIAQLVEGGWHGSTEEIARLLRDVAIILAFLHDKLPPLIHRDVKPQNILVDDDQNVSLVDLGAVCTRPIREGMAAGSTIIGTPGYVPLEQFSGRPQKASDIYALGMVGVFLLTHQEPAELLGADGRTPYRDHIGVVDEGLLTILDQMIEPLAADRPVSMHTVIEHLDRFIAGDVMPVLPVVVTTNKPRRTKRWVLLTMAILGAAWVARPEAETPEPTSYPDNAPMHGLNGFPQNAGRIGGLGVLRQRAPTAVTNEAVDPCLFHLAHADDLELDCRTLETEVDPTRMRPGLLRGVESVNIEDADAHLVIVDFTPEGRQERLRFSCPNGGTIAATARGADGRFHLLCESYDDEAELHHLLYDEKKNKLEPVATMAGNDIAFANHEYEEDDGGHPRLIVPHRGPATVIYTAYEDVGSSLHAQPIRAGRKPYQLGVRDDASGRLLMYYLARGRLHGLYARLSGETGAGLDLIPVVFSSLGQKALPAIATTPTDQERCGSDGTVVDGQLELHLLDEAAGVGFDAIVKDVDVVVMSLGVDMDTWVCPTSEGLEVRADDKRIELRTYETRIEDIAATCSDAGCVFTYRQEANPGPTQIAYVKGAVR